MCCRIASLRAEEAACEDMLMEVMEGRGIEDDAVPAIDERESICGRERMACDALAIRDRRL